MIFFRPSLHPPMHPSLFNARPSVCTEDLDKAVQRDEIAQRSGDRLPQLRGEMPHSDLQARSGLAGGGTALRAQAERPGRETVKPLENQRRRGYK